CFVMARKQSGAGFGTGSMPPDVGSVSTLCPMTACCLISMLMPDVAGSWTSGVDLVPLVMQPILLRIVTIWAWIFLMWRFRKLGPGTLDSTTFTWWGTCGPLIRPALSTLYSLVILSITSVLLMVKRYSTVMPHT